MLPKWSMSELIISLTLIAIVCSLSNAMATPLVLEAAIVTLAAALASLFGNFRPMVFAALLLLLAVQRFTLFFLDAHEILTPFRTSTAVVVAWSLCCALPLAVLGRYPTSRPFRFAELCVWSAIIITWSAIVGCYLAMGLHPLDWLGESGSRWGNTNTLGRDRLFWAHGFVYLVSILVGLMLLAAARQLAERPWPQVLRLTLYAIFLWPAAVTLLVVWNSYELQCTSLAGQSHEWSMNLVVCLLLVMQLMVLPLTYRARNSAVRIEQTQRVLRNISAWRRHHSPSVVFSDGSSLIRSTNAS